MCRDSCARTIRAEVIDGREHRCACYERGRLDALAESVHRATEAYRAGRETERQLQDVPDSGTGCGSSARLVSIDLDRMPVTRWSEPDKSRAYCGDCKKPWPCPDKHDAECVLPRTEPAPKITVPHACWTRIGPDIEVWHNRGTSMTASAEQWREMADNDTIVSRPVQKP